MRRYDSPRSTLRRQRGQSLVEFALVLTPLLFVIAGFVDVARAVYLYNSLSEAASAGARYAIVHGASAATKLGPTGGCGTELETIVRARVAGSTPSDVTVTCTWPNNSNTPGNPVVVEARMTFRPLMLEFVGGVPITLRGQSEKVISY